MKSITSLSALSLIFAGVLLAACNSQKSTQPDVYVAGCIEMPGDEVDVEVNSVSIFTGRDTTIVIQSKSKYYATVWKNGVAQKLTDGTNEAGARSVYVSGSDVYVAGYDGNVATVWKNGVAQNLTDGTYEAKANSVFVSGDDVYVVGLITMYEAGKEVEVTVNEYHQASGKTTIRKYMRKADKYYVTVWKNGVAQNLTNETDWATAHSVFVSGNDVYVAGQEKLVGKLWKNGVAQNLTDIIPCSVFVSGNDVYMAGSGRYTIKIEEHFPAIPYALIWKNGIVQRLTDEDITITESSNRENVEFSTASSIFVSGDDVYVLGSAGKMSGKSSSIILWKNGEAQILADGSIWDYASVFVYDNDVYLAFNRILMKNGVAQNLEVDENARRFQVSSVFVK